MFGRSNEHGFLVSHRNDKKGIHNRLLSAPCPQKDPKSQLVAPFYTDFSILSKICKSIDFIAKLVMCFDSKTLYFPIKISLIFNFRPKRFLGNVLGGSRCRSCIRRAVLVLFSIFWISWQDPFGHHFDTKGAKRRSTSNEPGCPWRDPAFPYAMVITCRRWDLLFF